MENTDYQISKKQFLLQPVAYKEVARNEIVAMDGTHYKLGTAEVALTTNIADDIDRFIGVTLKLNSCHLPRTTNSCQTACG